MSGLDVQRAYDLTIYAPDSAVVGYDFFYEQAAAEGDYLACEYMDPTGQYTLRLTDSDTGALLVTGYFTVSDPAEPEPEPEPDPDPRTPTPKANTTLSVQRSAVGDDKWAVRGRLLRDGSPWVNRPAVIQVRLDGVWRKLSRVKYTTDRGRVRWTSSPEPGAGQYVLRLFAKGNSTTKAAASTRFRLPHRP